MVQYVPHITSYRTLQSLCYGLDSAGLCLSEQLHTPSIALGRKEKNCKKNLNEQKNERINKEVPGVWYSKNKSNEICSEVHCDTEA
jgi:hypothetical protein